MTGGNLDVAKRDAGVEGGHDERSAEHVGVHGAKPGTLADGPDPAVSGTPVEAAAVTATQDWSLPTLTDDEVNGSCCAGNERDDGRLVALADDPQRAVAAFEREVFDVGGARPR